MTGAPSLTHSVTGLCLDTKSDTTLHGATGDDNDGDVSLSAVVNFTTDGQYTEYTGGIVEGFSLQSKVFPG